MILENIEKLLLGRTFVSMGTASKKAEPQCAPKFIFKVKGHNIYLIDYAMAVSAANLKENPRASLSFMDLDNIEGYRLTGSVKLIEEGPVFDEILKEYQSKLIKLTATRVIEGMKSGKKSPHFELEMPERFLVIKFTIEKAVKIGLHGDLESETWP